VGVTRLVQLAVAAAEQLQAMFRYGWRADDGQMHAYVEQCVREAATDWLNAGARPELVRQVVRRCFLHRGGWWERRPSISEIVTVAGPDPSRAIFPSVDLYDRITCPLTIVLADGGFYAQRRAEVQAIVDTVPDRRLIDIASNHNVTMTRPAELAAVILELVAGQTSPMGDDH
jgi:pimeloyl-ACP methyl ester carboxylesterase